MPHELPYGTSMDSFASPYELTTRAGSVSAYSLGKLRSLAGPQSYGAAGIGAPPGGAPPAPAPMQASTPSFDLGEVDMKRGPMPTSGMTMPEMKPLAKKRAPRWPLFLFLFSILVLIALAVWFFTR
jgi:hypothetical protein